MGKANTGEAGEDERIVLGLYVLLALEVVYLVGAAVAIVYTS